MSLDIVRSNTYYIWRRHGTNGFLGQQKLLRARQVKLFEFATTPKSRWVRDAAPNLRAAINIKKTEGAGTHNITTERINKLSMDALFLRK